MECYVFVTFDNIIYTNFDLISEKRKAKLALIGYRGHLVKHDISYLHTIESECDKIIMGNPHELVGKYTFAFEVIFRNIKDVTKIYTQYIGYTVLNFGKKIRTSAVSKTDFNNLVSEHLWKVSEPEYEEKQRWYRAFYLAYTRLYNIPNKDKLWDIGRTHADEELGHLEKLSGVIEYDDKSYIFTEDLQGKYIHNFKEYNIIIRYMDRHKAVKVSDKLILDTNYNILPINIGKEYNKALFMCSKQIPIELFMSKVMEVEDYF